MLARIDFVYLDGGLCPISPLVQSWMQTRLDADDTLLIEESSDSDVESHQKKEEGQNWPLPPHTSECFEVKKKKKAQEVKMTEKKADARILDYDFFSSPRTRRCEL